uniref:N-acetyl-D-glucosamine kinase n=1 Tax=Ascaris suum TaxID=6253 RepID=F1KYW5_ASCSU
MNVEYWKHVWPSSEVLGEFVNSNASLFRNTTVVELGAGATGIPGIVASKCGAELVILTEHPHNQQALDLLKLNCIRNALRDSSFLVQGLDWESIPAIDSLLDQLHHLDFILAADVFYDPKVFESLVAAIAHIVDRFTSAQCFFTYEERDSEWSIEDLLFLNSLQCSPIRKIQSNQKTIHIGVIYSSRATMKSTSFFAGIEGGATQSHLVIIDDRGKKYGEWSHKGLNYHLEGRENVANEIAEWIRSVKKQLGMNGPLGAVGMGLSGAEDESVNEHVVGILRRQHGDVANEFFLTSDSVITIAATFNKGGVVVVAGTGSSCRLLKADGTVCGVGGWGHQIGDGGSGYWIANRAIRYVFDDEDGLSPSPYPITTVKRLLLEHFNIKDKIGILDSLYANFKKAHIASFTGKLAKEAANDPLVKVVFHEAGVLLGSHVRAISSHFDQEMLLDVPVVLVGSVFKSWSLVKAGFIEGVRKGNEGSRIKKVTLYLLEETPAVGAALLAARNVSVEVPHQQTSVVFDVLTFD